MLVIMGGFGQWTCPILMEWMRYSNPQGLEELTGIC